MPNHYLCGVPHEHCSAGSVPCNSDLIPGSAIKAHGAVSDAFKCHRRWLVEVLGYEQVGGREFRPPDGGPILVLTKKGRFGGRLRSGKTKGRAMPRTGRAGIIY